MSSDDEFLYVEEIARICRVPESSVRHWLQTGKLTSVRPGRRRLVRRRDFESFLRDRTSVAHAAPVPTAEAVPAIAAGTTA